ncbi:MAG TPA: helix-turn-helix domain-containing protein [Nitrospira sp.]|nr:helix-turn-helix domain-containing protein [Nitrospira sp.]
MDLSTPLRLIEQAIGSVMPTDCPALLGELERLKGLAQLRLLTGAVTNGHAPNSEALLTIPEVAKRLKVSEYRAYELARQGILPSIRLGKSVRVKPSALAEYLAKQGV